MIFDIIIGNFVFYDIIIKKLFLSKLYDIYYILRSDQTSWKKNLILIVIAQLITMAGMSACVPFLPLFVRELGVTDMNEVKFWSGIVFSGPYVLSIIAVPILGSLGDKYGRKLMVVRAIIGLALAMFLMGFAQNVWQLFLLRVFQGLVSGFIAASLAFISAETPSDKSGFAISFLQSAQSAGTIAGPLLGGFLSDLVGIRPVFFVVSLMCLLSGILIIMFVKENNFSPNTEKRSSTINQFLAMLSNKDIRLIMILIVISQAGIHFTTPIFPFFVEKINTNAEYLSTITGVLIGIVGIFSIVFAPVWGRRNDRYDYKNTVMLTSAFVGIFTVLQLLVKDWLLLIPFRIVIGIFIAAIVPTLYAALSKKSDKANIGGAMSIASSANLFGALLSFTLCAHVASNFGIESVFVTSGILLLIVPVTLLFLTKNRFFSCNYHQKY